MDEKEQRICEIIEKYQNSEFSNNDDIWLLMLHTDLITPPIIEAYPDKFPLYKVLEKPSIYYEKYGYKFLEANKKKIEHHYWSYVTGRKINYTPNEFSFMFVEKFADVLDWDILSKQVNVLKVIPLDFYEKYKNKLNITCFISHPSVTMEMIDEAIECDFKKSPNIYYKWTNVSWSICRNPNFDDYIVKKYIKTLFWPGYLDYLNRNNITAPQEIIEPILEIFFKGIGMNTCIVRDISYYLKLKCVKIEYIKEEYIKKVREKEAYERNCKPLEWNYKVLEWDGIYENPNVWDYLIDNNLQQQYANKIAMYAPRDVIESLISKFGDEWWYSPKVLIKTTFFNGCSYGSIKNIWIYYVENPKLGFDFFDLDNNKNITSTIAKTLLGRENIPLWFIEKYEHKIDEYQLWENILSPSLFKTTNYIEKYEKKLSGLSKDYLGIIAQEWYIGDENYLKFKHIFNGIKYRSKKFDELYKKKTPEEWYKLISEEVNATN